ncbi:MAG: hypothetical protein GY791_08625 [Alphaproteobacteria bacterium]|nr:hypothetical protein [Alphaproteobacteria bacterium]
MTDQTDTLDQRQVVLPEGEYAKYLADYAARVADERASEVLFAVAQAIQFG